MPGRIQIGTKKFKSASAGALMVKGDLDAHTFDQLDVALNDMLDEGLKYLLVDMARVPYISSAGMGVLIGAQNETEALDGGMVLVGVTDAVLEIFKTMGFDRLFTIAPSVEDAFKRLGLALPQPARTQNPAGES